MIDASVKAGIGAEHEGRIILVNDESLMSGIRKDDDLPDLPGPVDETHEDLIAGTRHLEDLEIFVGQRSRMHPGPGLGPGIDDLAA